MIARLFVAQLPHHISDGVDVVIVDRQDLVAASQACLVRRPFVDNSTDAQLALIIFLEIDTQGRVMPIDVPALVAGAAAHVGLLAALGVKLPALVLSLSPALLGELILRR